MTRKPYVPVQGPTLRDAARKALDALLDADATGALPLFIQAAIDSLQAALADQPQQKGAQA